MVIMCCVPELQMQEAWSVCGLCSDCPCHLISNGACMALQVLIKTPKMSVQAAGDELPAHSEALLAEGV